MNEDMTQEGIKRQMVELQAKYDRDTKRLLWIFAIGFLVLNAGLWVVFG